MSIDPSPIIILASGGFVGVVAVVLAVVAYLEFRGSEYRQILLPIIGATAIFTLSHGLLYVWPQHPPIVNALEPLSYTVVALGVLRLITLHPEITVTARGDRK